MQIKQFFLDRVVACSTCRTTLGGTRCLDLFGLQLAREGAPKFLGMCTRGSLLHYLEYRQLIMGWSLSVASWHTAYTRARLQLRHMPAKDS